MTTVTCPFTRDHPDRDHPDWCDPFPEPRALPGGWDLAELPRYEPSPSSGREFVLAAVPDTLAAELIERRPDPFPECNTFPGGWDLADVLALERERMETKDSEPEQVNFLLPLSVDAFAYQAV
jgi:hypothetical protein